MRPFQIHFCSYKDKIYYKSKSLSYICLFNRDTATQLRLEQKQRRYHHNWFWRISNQAHTALEKHILDYQKSTCKTLLKMVLCHRNVQDHIIAATDNYPWKVFQKLFPMVNPELRVLHQKKGSARKCPHEQASYTKSHRKKSHHTHWERKI